MLGTTWRQSISVLPAAGPGVCGWQATLTMDWLVLESHSPSHHSAPPNDKEGSWSTGDSGSHRGPSLGPKGRCSFWPRTRFTLSHGATEGRPQPSRLPLTRTPPQWYEQAQQKPGDGWARETNNIMLTCMSVHTFAYMYSYMCMYLHAYTPHQQYNAFQGNPSDLAFPARAEERGLRRTAPPKQGPQAASLDTYFGVDGRALGVGVYTNTGLCRYRSTARYCGACGSQNKTVTGQPRRPEKTQYQARASPPITLLTFAPLQ